MSTVKPNSTEKSSQAHLTKSALQAHSVKVAVATVMHELIADTETYWLTAAGDGHTGHELWSEFDMLPGRFTCEVRHEDCDGLTAKKAAERLLEGLWMRRHPIALSLVSFEDAGLVSMRQLKRLTKAREPADVGRQAHGHHGQGLGAEVAEVEPVGPDAVEVLVELPHLRDRVDLKRVVVEAFDEELEPAHHRREFHSLRQHQG